MHNFNNRNSITKTKLPSHNFAINTTNLQEYMKICQSCEKKEIENKINIIFSFNKNDNIGRNVFNDINDVDSKSR